MRLILLFLIMFSCSFRRENCNKFLFSSDSKFNSFCEKMYSSSLNLLQLNKKEIEFDTTYRLLVIPNELQFRYVIEYKNKRNNWIAKLKVFNLSDSSLSSSCKVYYNFNVLNNIIQESKAWSLNNENNICNGADGTVYILDLITRKKCARIVRWTPKNCHYDKNRGFIMLVNFLKKEVASLQMSEITRVR